MRLAGGHLFPPQYLYRTDAEVVTAVIHEMAHFLEKWWYFQLSFEERGRRPKGEFFNNETTELWFHSDMFQRALAKAATAWYGDPKQYNWAHEDGATYAWAIGHGLAA